MHTGRVFSARVEDIRRHRALRLCDCEAKDGKERARWDNSAARADRIILATADRHGHELVLLRCRLYTLIGHRSSDAWRYGGAGWGEWRARLVVRLRLSRRRVASVRPSVRESLALESRDRRCRHHVERKLCFVILQSPEGLILETP